MTTNRDADCDEVEHILRALDRYEIALGLHARNELLTEDARMLWHELGAAVLSLMALTCRPDCTVAQRLPDDTASKLSELKDRAREWF